FRFLPTKIEISNANESCNCGFGHGVRANGIYYLRNDTIPEFYIDRHGDSINISNTASLLLDNQ
nr:hypothetical protein [Bacteroidales bacterium]